MANKDQYQKAFKTTAQKVDIWVVTQSVNDYNQYGDYLISAFTQKPSFAELKQLLPDESDETIGRLTRGGGRKNDEGTWYYLFLLKAGQKYTPQ